MYGVAADFSSTIYGKIGNLNSIDVQRFYNVHAYFILRRSIWHQRVVTTYYHVMSRYLDKSTVIPAAIYAADTRKGTTKIIKRHTFSTAGACAPNWAFHDNRDITLLMTS